MATGTIPLFAQYKGIFTAKTGFSGKEYSVRRVGNIVVVKGYMTKTGGFGTSQVVAASISGVPKPSQATRFTCSSGPHAYDANTCAYGGIDTIGDIFFLLTNGAHETVVFNFWYPIN